MKPFSKNFFRSLALDIYVRLRPLNHITQYCDLMVSLTQLLLLYGYPSLSYEEKTKYTSELIDLHSRVMKLSHETLL